MMVDFKFDTLYRYVSIEPPEVGGLKKVNRKFVWLGGAVCANPT